MKSSSRQLRRAVAIWTMIAGVLAGLSCNDGSTQIAAVGKPAAMLIVSGDLQQATVGSELPAAVVVRVVDSAGKSVKGQILSFRVVAGGGSVFAGTGLTNDAGEARERWTLGTVSADSQRLEARAVDAASGAALVFATFRATAVAGAASKLKKASADSIQATVATAVTTPPSVKVTDQFDNPVAGTAVAFAVASGGGSLTGGSQVSNASGIATVGSWTLGATAGTNTLTATSAGLAGSPVSFTASGVRAQLFASRLTAGNDYTCGLTSTGVALCWGRNLYGQLGDGTTADARGFPMNVLGGLTFASLTAGGSHTCGLTSVGAAYCWGYNGSGNLGDGTTTQRTIPVAVLGGLTFVSLTAGGSHTCGLTSVGAAYCWGGNQGGRLGDGTTTQRTIPVAVLGGLTFVSLTAGGSHTCGLTSVGAAYCWGENTEGQLGDGTSRLTVDTTTTSSFVYRTTPTAVLGGLTFASLTAGGSHTCGLTNTGVAYCWGENFNGRLGDGTATQRTTPTAVSGGLTFTSLTLGRHTCGLTSAGAAYCWGHNYYGQLGDGSAFNERTTPVSVVGGLTFTSLTAGDLHTCGLASVGAAYCWGHNGSGNLGDGTLSQRLTPVAVIRP